MTVELWRACLARFEAYGNRSEQLMARMLLTLCQIDDPMVVRIFDAYASEILEAAP
jgi:hypothetical protein